MNWNVHEGGCQDKLLRGHSLECLRFTHVFCPSNFLELKWEKISGTKGEKMELSQSGQVTINLCRKCMKCFQFHTCLDLRDNPVRVFKNLSTTDVNLGRFYAYQGQV